FGKLTLRTRARPRKNPESSVPVESGGKIRFRSSNLEASMQSNEVVLEIPQEEILPKGTSGAPQGQKIPSNSSASKEQVPEKLTQYEFIDSQELARRLTVPQSWIRDQVRARSQDPLPHVNLGKYVRFLWGSPALELWIRRRIVVGNNRRVERVR